MGSPHPPHVPIHTQQRRRPLFAAVPPPRPFVRPSVPPPSPPFRPSVRSVMAAVGRRPAVDLLPHGVNQDDDPPCADACRGSKVKGQPHHHGNASPPPPQQPSWLPVTMATIQPQLRHFVFPVTMATGHNPPPPSWLLHCHGNPSVAPPPFWPPCHHGNTSHPPPIPHPSPPTSAILPPPSVPLPFPRISLPVTPPPFCPPPTHFNSSQPRTLLRLPFYPAPLPHNSAILSPPLAFRPPFSPPPPPQPSAIFPPLTDGEGDLRHVSHSRGHPAPYERPRTPVNPSGGCEQREPPKETAAPAPRQQSPLVRRHRAGS